MNSPVHMLKRFAGFVVSTLWMTFASTWRTGASKVMGMMAVDCSNGRAGSELGSEGMVTGFSTAAITRSVVEGAVLCCVRSGCSADAIGRSALRRWRN
jgi:hypothetical protein